MSHKGREKYDCNQCDAEVLTEIFTYAGEGFPAETIAAPQFQQIEGNKCYKKGNGEHAGIKQGEPEGKRVAVVK